MPVYTKNEFLDNANAVVEKMDARHPLDALTFSSWEEIRKMDEKFNKAKRMFAAGDEETAGDELDELIDGAKKAEHELISALEYLMNAATRHRLYDYIINELTPLVLTAVPIMADDFNAAQAAKRSGIWRYVDTFVSEIITMYEVDAGDVYRSIGEELDKRRAEGGLESGIERAGQVRELLREVIGEMVREGTTIPRATGRVNDDSPEAQPDTATGPKEPVAPYVQAMKDNRCDCTPCLARKKWAMGEISYEEWITGLLERCDAQNGQVLIVGQALDELHAWPDVLDSSLAALERAAAKFGWSIEEAMQDGVAGYRIRHTSGVSAHSWN